MGTAVSRCAEMPSWRVLLALVTVAVLVRTIHLTSVASTPMFTYHRSFEASDMYLFDQWARRIVAGDVLGREPYQPIVGWQLATAPSESWQRWYGNPLVLYKAPFYPYLIAVLYRLFGDPMLPLAILQIVIAAGSLLLLVAIGTSLFDRLAGGLGGLMFALYGPAVHYDVIMLRGPWIVVAALLVTWQLVRVRPEPTPRQAAILGLTLGGAVLVNEGFSTLPVFVLLLLAWWSRRPGRVAVRGAALLAGVAAALSPVVIRNLVVGAPALQLAVTGGVVYAVFNAADSSPYFFAVPRSLKALLAATDGKMLPLMHACWNSFGSVGTAVGFYVRKAIGLVVPWENPDNVNLYYAALKSPVLAVLPGYGGLLPASVVGLAVALRRPRSLEPLLPVVLCLTLSTMLTLPLSRYRATLAVFLMPLAGLAVAEAIRWGGARRVTPLVLAALGFAATAAAAAVLQQRVVFGGSRAAPILYRRAEFAVSLQTYARAGRYREVLVEALELARHNPSPAVRTGVLATIDELGLQRVDEAAVRDFLPRFAEAARDDPQVLMAVGDFYGRRLHDPDRAAAFFRAARALHPREPLERALRERLGMRDGAPPRP